MMPICTRVFIAEQDQPTMIMLSLYLEQFDDIEIVGSAMPGSALEEQVRRLKPEVIIYNLTSSPDLLPNLISKLKNSDRAPALICIREGNFLPLEGIFKETPEALLPSFTSAECLLETIRRSADRYRRQSATTPAKSATGLPSSALPKAG